MEQKKRKLNNPTQTVAKRRKRSHPPRLPAELELQILSILVVPTQPCVPHYFGKCYDEWSCAKFLNHSEPLLTPVSNLLSVSTSWRDEALKYFFANNTFVFNTEAYKLPQPQLDGEEFWQELRDPHATRLLNFVDRPDWKDTGSKLWRHNFSYPHAEHIDRYRHSIRKLALIYQPHNGRATTEPRSSDWGWIFKVDWKTLPDLEILYLDFKGIVELQRWEVHMPLVYQDKLRDYAERMKCLSLKKLVLMNVDYGNDGIVSEFEKEEFRKMWRKALAPRGEFVIELDYSQKW